MLVECITPSPKQDTIKRGRLTPPSPKNSSKTKLVQRLWNAAEAQICDIELRLKSLDSTTVQFEKDARSLGLLVKFLKELVSIECLMSKKKTSKKANKLKIEDNDAPPRNLEDFRQELEKRLDAMRKGRQPETVDGDDRPALALSAAG
jgi:hypothetical protein